MLGENSTDNFAVNMTRILMAAISIVLILHSKINNYKNLHKRFFAYSILFCCLCNYLFWSYSQIHLRLSEGGPMLVAATLVAIPMLHLGYKLILWLIVGLGLISIQVFTSVSILWTLYFYFAMAIVMGSIQYQLDILLRTQYRGELIEAEKAKTDQLTGLYNRHSFDAQCKNLISQLQPSQHVALAMIDIDYFKKYNDNYGHLEGDRVLVKVAELLSDCGADVVVRFGGEEFILVKILHMNELNWLHDLPQRFAANAIPHKYSLFNRITVSAGIAVAEYSEELVMTKALLTAADADMYKAKNAGRDKVLFTKI